VFHREPDGGYPEPGDHVDERSRLGEVETMGIRNAVTAPIEGTLIEILVPDRTPVEYGQPLAVVQPGAPDHG
jgi:acetyl-CoA carboxylase biotin carboxyl carrier protein